jgi:hypothetical protein
MTTKEFYPKDLNNPDGGDTRGRNRHLDMYRTKFDGWLSGTNRAPRIEKSVAVRFKWAAFFEWPAYRDGAEFVANFGDILRIRKDSADLVAVTLTEMSKFVGLDPSADEILTLKAPYLGVQLRSENDALASFGRTFIHKLVDTWKPRITQSSMRILRVGTPPNAIDSPSRPGVSST